MRKGIILAGGSATRLYPITSSISKQVLPIYDKPMIYYSLSILLIAGIKDILIISTPRDIKTFKSIFAYSKLLGLKITYKIQNKPNGIAEAFIIGERFIGKNKVALILGDNLFFGRNLQETLIHSSKSNKNSIFTYEVKNPYSYGVIKKTKKGIPIKIIEKPKHFISNEMVTGLYFYNNDVIKIVKELKPSKRNELEITDLNMKYLKKKKLNVVNLGRGTVWFDAGNPESLSEATNFIKSVQKREVNKIGCIEEIAYKKEYIKKDQLKKYLTKIPNGEYKDYLKKLI